MKNWKTTLAGVSMILSGVVLCVNGNYEAGVPSILGGIGLLVAKDHDKSGVN